MRCVGVQFAKPVDTDRESRGPHGVGGCEAHNDVVKLVLREMGVSNVRQCCANHGRYPTI